MPSLGGAGRGALTGASLGSFIPGVGTLVGGGLGALFGGLFGGGDDKPEVNPEDQYTALLNQSAQRNQARASELENLGSGNLADVTQYFRQLMSSNPSAAMDATRPERARVIDQYDTARKAIASFAPRSGGSTSVNAQSQFDQAESLADITSGAKRSAASDASTLGTSLLGLSLSAEQLASADLNSVINAVLKREGVETEERGQNMELVGGIGKTIGTIIGMQIGKGDT